MQSSPKNVGNLTHDLDVNTALLRTAPFAERDVLFIENPIIEFRHSGMLFARRERMKKKGKFADPRDSRDGIVFTTSSLSQRRARFTVE